MAECADDPRFVTFNPTPLWGSRAAPHVEVRLLGGTYRSEQTIALVKPVDCACCGPPGQAGDRLASYDLADPASNFRDLNIQDGARHRLPSRREFRVRETPRSAPETDFSTFGGNTRNFTPGCRPVRRPSATRLHARFKTSPACLTESDLANPTGAFMDLDDPGKLCALWCVLFGEGPLPAERHSTHVLCAERLRSQGWADYQRLRRDGPLYKTIRKALGSAGTDGWFDVPEPGLVRAFAGVKAATPSPANCVMDEGDWRDCVLRAMSQQHAGRVPRGGRQPRRFRHRPRVLRHPAPELRALG